MLLPPPTLILHSTRNATASPKTRDDIVKAPGMVVRDTETARAHLLIGAFMVEGMETSMGMLSMVMLQLSQMPKLTKPAIEAF
jgi:hypothetical protein